MNQNSTYRFREQSVVGNHSQEARPAPQKCQFPLTVGKELGPDLCLDPRVIHKCQPQRVLVSVFLSTPILAVILAAYALVGK